MKTVAVTILLTIIFAGMLLSFKNNESSLYTSAYNTRLNFFLHEQQSLLDLIKEKDLQSAPAVDEIAKQIYKARLQMKGMDFWFRYLEPLAYKKINGPLPLEWETEVFEKFEKPYKREGAGLTLAALYLEEKDIEKDSLLKLVRNSMEATEVFSHDSITRELKTYQHFYLCNRLFLLNLASIYTTGFECPDTTRIIPELRQMLESVAAIYKDFSGEFAATPLTAAYTNLYAQLISFANNQPANFSNFDHYTFIRNYINPLFTINQSFINQYGVRSKSLVDYSLNKKSVSIFSKNLYTGQNEKGVFSRVKDAAILHEIERLGKLFFYDPILSGNNKRSCASCHKPTEYFTDTAVASSFQLDHKNYLPRNTPSLVNAGFNHLLMLDGKHISLQNQATDVIANPVEMAADAKEVLQKILSCPQYKKALTKLLPYTPAEPEITMNHVVSAITFYYSKFSKGEAAFDDAMNKACDLGEAEKSGFNIFMSKAQCATCHFVPQFNGVKPPYIGSEFEVLGVPDDTGYKKISADMGRYTVNEATETAHAFRTGSLRNVTNTKPYMHNGVFSTMEQVIDFYDAGGGVGKGLSVTNQTLSSDSLKLSRREKDNLIAFMGSLNEKIVFEKAPDKLPLSTNKILNRRKPGGEY